ncbi:MAG: multicomponent Na+:H+ antiporter subunit F [Verrucomicrobiales bacterium]|jgi:multicomponent Na+:H+ antiporter subunit F
MMENVYLGFALLILLTVACGMFRALRSPTRADKILAALLLGTAGVAILLLLGVGLERPSFFDVALVFALLALVISVAFVRTAWSANMEDAQHDDS